MKKNYRNYSYAERRKQKNRIISIIILVFCTFIAYKIITNYLIKPYKICSNSMNPEIYNKNLVVSSNIYIPRKSAKRGELILISTKNIEKDNFLKTTISSLFKFFSFQLYQPFDRKNKFKSELAVRRIVGLPGDTIYMKDFILHIKTPEKKHFLSEFELAEIDYNIKSDTLPKKWDSTKPFSGTYPKTTLKSDEYFVLCDNRLISDDSRFWGPINGKTEIKGKVLMLYWPINKFKIYK